MIVTRTEAVTKVKYKVYIDGQFAFVLYKGELSRYQVKEGQEITEKTCERIFAEVLRKRAKLRAMHLLNDMGRTESQLRMKLERDGYPAEIIKEALDYVKSFGYIDDLNYAKSFIEGRKGKKSRKEIYMKLLEKGVSSENIEEAMEDCYEEEDASAAIRKLIEKRHFCPGKASYEDRQKLTAYLVRRGFAYDNVCRTMDAVIEEYEDS